MSGERGCEVILASRKGHASETNVAFLIMQKVISYQYHISESVFCTKNVCCLHF